MSKETIVFVRRKRPVSIWVLCIVNALLAAWLVAAAIRSEQFGFSSGQAAIEGFAGIFIAIATHATWFGNRKGRLALLILLTGFLGLLIVQSLRVIQWSVQTGYYAPFVGMAVLYTGLSLTWLCANYLLLNSKQAKAFFG